MGLSTEAVEPRRVSANISALAGGQIVTWLMSLAWTLVVPRALGPVGMGTLVTGWSAAAVLSVVLGLGMRNYLVREIVVRPGDATRLLGTAVTLRIVMLPALLLGATLYSSFSGFGGQQRLVILLATGATAITLLAEPMQAVFQASTRMEFLAYSEVVSKSAQGLLGVLLALVGLGAVGLTAAWLVVSGVVLVLDAWWIRPSARFTLRTNVTQIRSMARGSLSYWAFGLFYMLYLWIDSVILAVMTPQKVVGWYGVPTKLFTTLMFIPIILSTAWLPRFIKAFESDPYRLREVARAPVELAVVLSLPICSLTALLAGKAIPLLYGQAYEPAVPVMVVLSMCFPFVYLGIMLNQVLVAAKRQIVWTWVMAGATVVNPILNIMLIRIFQQRTSNGAIGAAVALLSTEFLIAVVGIIVVGHTVLDRWSVWRFARAALAAGALWTVATAAQPLGAAVSLAIGLVVFALVAWSLRIVSAGDLELLLVITARLRRMVPRRVGGSEADSSGHQAGATTAADPSDLEAPRPISSSATLSPFDQGTSQRGGELVFVVEHTLGHAVHGMNLAQMLTTSNKVPASVIQLGENAPVPDLTFPVLRSWSVRASMAARRALSGRDAETIRALYIHTPVAALLVSSLMHKVPTILSMDATPIGYDSLGAYYGHKRQVGVVEWGKLQAHRHLYAKAEALITWSHWAARSLVEDYRVPEEKVHVIRPGVDLTRFFPPPTPPRNDKMRILFVGGDFARKGGTDLIEAARLLGDRVELELVTSAVPCSIPPGVTARVHLDMAPRSEALIDLYRSSDVLALPSRGECYGLVISEAMACGLPVVASGVGAIPELVVDGKTGLLCPAGDPYALSQALFELADSPESRAAMAENALETARREHDARHNCEAIVELMQRVAGERGPLTSTHPSSDHYVRAHSGTGA